MRRSMQHEGGAFSYQLLVNGKKMRGLDGKAKVDFAESSDNRLL